MPCAALMIPVESDGTLASCSAVAPGRNRISAVGRRESRASRRRPAAKACADGQLQQERQSAAQASAADAPRRSRLSRPLPRWRPRAAGAASRALLPRSCAPVLEIAPPSMLMRGSQASHAGICHVRAPMMRQHRRQQQAADHERVEEHGAGEAQPELLDDAVFAEHEREEHADHDRGGRGDDAPGQRQALLHRALSRRRCVPSARACARRGTPRSPSTGRTRSRTASPG